MLIALHVDGLSNNLWVGVLNVVGGRLGEAWLNHRGLNLRVWGSCNESQVNKLWTSRVQLNMEKCSKPLESARL